MATDRISRGINVFMSFIKRAVVFTIVIVVMAGDDGRYIGAGAHNHGAGRRRWHHLCQSILVGIDNDFGAGVLIKEFHMAGLKNGRQRRESKSC